MNYQLSLDEYLQDVLVRLAHHSSAIEGNTITLPDTVTIILHGKLPGGYDRREYFEIENHRYAFQYVIDQVKNKEKLDIPVILDIHERLTDRLLIEKGRFKTNENAVKGADFNTATPQETPMLMDQWVNNLNYQLDHVKEDKEKVKVISDFHIQFERIHPFSDGNGRTGRMLINYSLFQNNLPPLIIESDDRYKYINYLAKQDIKGLADFSWDLINKEAKRINQFMNKEKIQVKEQDINEFNIER